MFSLLMEHYALEVGSRLTRPTVGAGLETVAIGLDKFSQSGIFSEEESKRNCETANQGIHNSLN